jgi:hypothetical protein
MDGHVHRAAACDRPAGEARVKRRVYGRVEYAEPLAEVGAADDVSDAQVAFPGEWVELITFPEHEMHWIIRDGHELDK